jgi:hypothetical protein
MVSWVAPRPAARARRRVEERSMSGVVLEREKKNEMQLGKERAD